MSYKMLDTQYVRIEKVIISKQLMTKINHRTTIVDKALHRVMFICCYGSYGSMTKTIKVKEEVALTEKCSS